MGGMEISSRDLGHMTKMATMSIYFPFKNTSLGQPLKGTKPKIATASSLYRAITNSSDPSIDGSELTARN